MDNNSMKLPVDVAPTPPPYTRTPINNSKTKEDKKETLEDGRTKSTTTKRTRASNGGQNRPKRKKSTGVDEA